ncbi:5-methylcytosine-specific restriction protein A [Sphingobium sp. B2D3B]|uniref:HNH endonuclease n=1 Tax=Sphingobium sp. B2D3B TaxID=2940580 RepID=UPI0022241070|nr:HNH endonuclease signature motif containing protein [Sphingobium sp. B2D3B]MCW2382118.1 5-methylcytosine-specific restriction protein A [Sphingobium sp. B2D3B]
MRVEDARMFIEQKVFDPALSNPGLPEKAKATIRNTRSWLPRFRRIGDLIAYMDRFKGTGHTDIYRDLKLANLLTFEDIHDEFMSIFGKYASERTRLDDFVVGKRYTGSELVIFAEVYDNRSGGILLIGPVGNPQAVFLKATLSGGKYPNAWISEPERLRYYLKSRMEVFSETYMENAAIINNPELPIYVFHRTDSTQPFTFSGLFKNEAVHHEADGSKWFELVRSKGIAPGNRVDESELRRDFLKKVLDAEQTPRQQRLARLKTAPKRPAMVATNSIAFVRNPDVVAEVLFRSGGICDGCGAKAPFKRNADGSPYLEVHHKKHLSEGGDDTVENAIAVCPNCHRREHFGPRRWFD